MRIGLVLVFLLILHCGAGVLSFEVKGNHIPFEVLERISTFNGKLWLNFNEVRYRGGGDCFARSTSFTYELY